MWWRHSSGIALAALGALTGCGQSGRSVSDSARHPGAGGSGAGAGSPASGGSGALGEAGSSGDVGGSTNGGSSGTQGGSAGNPGGSSGAGRGASGGASGGAGAPDRDDHTPDAVVPSCVQVKPPAEKLPVPTDVRIGSVALRASERDCRWTVGEPMPLPLEPDDPVELLFQFDLNGDHIDDLIFGDHAVGTSTAMGKPLLLLESHLEDGELTYERSPCDSAWDDTYRSFYARDLNGDDEPDFVIGRINGVSALLNLAGERPEVLHFDWAPGKGSDAWASVLDVAVGDFDADGRGDVAVGYDRATGQTMSSIESGVLLFRDRSSRGTYGAPEQLTGVSYDPLNGLGFPTEIPSGLLASIPTQAGASALYTLFRSTPTSGLRYDGNTPTGFQIGSLASVPIFARSAEFGGEHTLMVADMENIQMVEPESPHSPVWGFGAAFRHAYDHELGGGTRVPSVFLLDIDGDGDEDLVERGSLDDRDPVALWIRNRSSATEFASTQLIQDEHYSSRFIESPFVRAGVMPGRLFVSDGSADTAAVWPIVCSGAP